MELLVERKWPRATYTIGNLYINGKFFSNTLEDTDRGLTEDMTVEEIKAKKVYGKTAIPKGTYKVTMTMSNHFKRILPSINNVKGFTGVRIHAGNTAEDTLGCILVGKNDMRGQIHYARATENELVKIILDANEDVKLIIR